MRFKRGLVSCFIAILCLSVFLAGCSSNAKTGNEGSGSKGTKEGGVLTIARLSDADNLDPHFITNIPSASVVCIIKCMKTLYNEIKTWILSRC